MMLLHGIPSSRCAVVVPSAHREFFGSYEEESAEGVAPA